MSNLIQHIGALFDSAAAWGANLPQFILVPLVMVLALVGTIVIVSLILGLIRLVFGQKAIDFIKNMPQHLNNTTNGLNGSQSKQ